MKPDTLQSEKALPGLKPTEARSRCVQLVRSFVTRLNDSKRQGQSNCFDEMAALLLLMLTRGRNRPPSQDLIEFCEGLTETVRELLAGTEAHRRLALERNDPVEAARWQSLKRDLDFGLARAFGSFCALARAEAMFTDSADLLVEMMMLAKGNSDEAKKLVARYQKFVAGKFAVRHRRKPLFESVLEFLARETANHVKHLAELAERFPAQIMPLARRSSAWPVMRSERDAEGYGFSYAVRVLELGRDYPVDTSPSARFRPSSPMERYLTSWVERVHEFRLSVSYSHPRWSRPRTPSAETIRRCWRDKNEPEPGPSVVAVLRQALGMPPLTKTTSVKWSERVIVPLIMLTDAGTHEETCRTPALQAIWREIRVKNAQAFKRRLLIAVRQTLRERARPG